MEPPVRADIEIIEFEGRTLVVAQVPELDPRFKPCFVKQRGEFHGSFTRGGDGDRRLTDFEIHLLHTNRGQPQDDREPVDGATIDDLDGDEVAYTLRRIRQRQRRAFAGMDDLAVLRRLNVVTSVDEGRLVPTIAGLLTFGEYPQQFFPQLNVTFVVYPGRSPEDRAPGGPRFLDNRSFDGPIPLIVEDAIAAVVRNMAVRSFIEGAGRRDVQDYPVEALREAIVNGLVHRDYSPYSRGTAVQIVMFADRLVIANPGGLFGAVTEDDLGGEGVSSTRNPVLMKLLQDVRLPDSDRTVCENRGSGIPNMLREMRQTGSALPEFHNRITRFRVTLPKHALLDEETMAWLAALGSEGLTPTQHMGLALMRDGRTITNQTLRNLGLDSRRATLELSDLVSRGLAIRVGERRHARYLLGPSIADLDVGASPKERGTGGTADREATVLDMMPVGHALSRHDIQQATGLPQATVVRAINGLMAAGRVEATAPARSPARKYRRRW